MLEYSETAPPPPDGQAIGKLVARSCRSGPLSYVRVNERDSNTQVNNQLVQDSIAANVFIFTNEYIMPDFINDLLMCPALRSDNKAMYQAVGQVLK